MLTGKIALVTGASRGLGKSISIALAKKGATVIINYAGNASLADDVVKEIEENAGKAKAYRCNVGDFTAVGNMINDIVKEFGQIDIVVNNAGITKDNLILKMSEEDFDTVINVNLKGAFNTMKHAGKYMIKKRSGRIINISSVSGIMGNAGQVNYSAAKAGIIGMTKSFAKEVASRGITCNVIAPGFINTDMTAALPDSIKTTVTEQVPLKRFGQPEDIAEMVVHLADDSGNYITGQVFTVDGGISM